MCVCVCVCVQFSDADPASWDALQCTCGGHRYDAQDSSGPESPASHRLLHQRAEGLGVVWGNHFPCLCEYCLWSVSVLSVVCVSTVCVQVKQVMFSHFCRNCVSLHTKTFHTFKRKSPQCVVFIVHSLTEVECKQTHMLSRRFSCLKTSLRGKLTN